MIRFKINYDKKRNISFTLQSDSSELIVFEIVKIFNLFLEHGVLLLLIAQAFQGDIRTHRRLQVCGIVDILVTALPVRTSLLFLACPDTRPKRTV